MKHEDITLLITQLVGVVRNFYMNKLFVVIKSEYGIYIKTVGRKS